MLRHGRSPLASTSAVATGSATTYGTAIGAAYGEGGGSNSTGSSDTSSSSRLCQVSTGPPCHVSAGACNGCSTWTRRTSVSLSSPANTSGAAACCRTARLGGYGSSQSIRYSTYSSSSGKWS